MIGFHINALDKYLTWT